MQFVLQPNQTKSVVLFLVNEKRLRQTMPRLPWSFPSLDSPSRRHAHVRSRWAGVRSGSSQQRCLVEGSHSPRKPSFARVSPKRKPLTLIFHLLEVEERRGRPLEAVRGYQRAQELRNRGIAPLRLGSRTPSALRRRACNRRIRQSAPAPAPLCSHDAGAGRGPIRATIQGGLYQDAEHERHEIQQLVCTLRDQNTSSQARPSSRAAC